MIFVDAVFCIATINTIYKTLAVVPSGLHLVVSIIPTRATAV
jgi:hypothetical protein